ncbi:12334_t:CDS:1, partial [Gigaspora rosea]
KPPQINNYLDQQEELKSSTEESEDDEYQTLSKNSKKTNKLWGS